MEKVDLVVVGGGIAGSAIAGRMGAAGASVLVLEQSEQFVDRVRGEYIAPWGVREVIALGLWDVVRSVAHSNVFTRFVGFEEHIPEDVAIATMRDFTVMVPDVPGAFGVSHPGLVGGAARPRRDVWRERGPRHVIGVRRPPTARPRRCAGASGQAVRGRRPARRRRRRPRLDAPPGARAGRCTRPKPTRFLAGMLVADTDDWPRDVACHGVEGETEYIMFPQADGLTRVYVGWRIDQPERFAGPDRQRKLLDSLRLECTSWSPAIADGTPAGPCSWFPMTDSWLDDPVHGRDRVRRRCRRVEQPADRPGSLGRACATPAC